MLGRRPSALDHETALRLVAGAVQPDDAPPGYSRVALLLTEAASPAPPVTADRAAATVAAMVEAVRSSSAAKAPRFQRLGAPSRIISARVAVVAGTLVLTAGGAAAATGSLPPSLQDATARVASYVGLNLPFPAKTDGDGAGEDTSSTDPASPAAPAGAGPAGAGHSPSGGQPIPAFDTVPANADNGPEAGSSSGPGQAVVSDGSQPSRPQNRPTDPGGVDTKSDQPSDPGEPKDPRESEPAAPLEPNDPVEVEPPNPTEPRDPSEPGDPSEPREGGGARGAFGPTAEDDDF